MVERKGINRLDFEERIKLGVAALSLRAKKRCSQELSYPLPEETIFLLSPKAVIRMFMPQILNEETVLGRQYQEGAMEILSFNKDMSISDFIWYAEESQLPFALSDFTVIYDANDKVWENMSGNPATLARRDDWQVVQYEWSTPHPVRIHAIEINQMKKEEMQNVRNILAQVELDARGHSRR